MSSPRILRSPSAGETVSQPPSDPQDERKWAQRKALLQAVLRYLVANGPTSWLALYLHFDFGGTGEIGPALGHLAICKHVVIEGTTAKITALGMEQLKTKA